MTTEPSVVEQRMIEHFVDRVIANRDKDRIDNSALPAGSPMYYYCRECRAFLTALPEEHFTPAPSLCEDCKRLKEHELLPDAKKALRKREGQIG